MEKTLIEKWLPLREINRDAAIEMAYKAVPAYIKHCRELGIPEKIIKKIKRNFYDPKIRSLHPWFARRPCSVSRALSLAAVLPSKIDKREFMKALGFENKTKSCIIEGYPPILFYSDPDRELINKILLDHYGKKSDEIVACDPMAGGGTIPLENLRLGFKSIAIEYNPVAYLIVKGTVEYPSIYGEKLANRVKDEIEKLIEYSRNELGEFYPEDAEGYIIARGIQCPECGGKIPLIRSTKINGKTYISLKFKDSKKEFEATISKYFTELPYQSEKRGALKCPYCNIEIQKKEAYKIWTENHLTILKELQKGIFDEEKILSTYVLLIKQTKKGYVICDANDISAFLEACKTLVNSFEYLKEYIPMDKIPEENEVFSTIREYGIKRWYELFTPRQLLVIGKLNKYVQDIGKELVSEGDLGAAITLYLAFGISRVVDYNSILTSWKEGTIRDSLGSYAQSRKMTYSEWFCEAIVPYRNLNWIFEVNSNKEKTEGGIYPVLKELCKRTGKIGKNALVIQGDSRRLSSILHDVKVDVINVDPPYFDTHIYSDISEYFWQMLRIILKPYIETEILFKKDNTINWDPQSPNVPRAGEIIVRKSAIKKKRKEEGIFDKDWYTSQMSTFLKECFKILKDDGILMVWFTHRSLEAWETIVSALYSAGFQITKIWPVTSELLTRLVSKRNNSTLNMTLIIVARKRMKNEETKNNLENNVIEMINEMYNTLSELDTTEIEFKTFLQAAAMCAATKIQPPSNESDLVRYIQSELIPKTKEIANNFISKLDFQTKIKKSKKSDLSDFL